MHIYIYFFFLVQAAAILAQLQQFWLNVFARDAVRRRVWLPANMRLRPHFIDEAVWRRSLSAGFPPR